MSQAARSAAAMRFLRPVTARNCGTTGTMNASAATTAETGNRESEDGQSRNTKSYSRANGARADRNRASFPR